MRWPCSIWNTTSCGLPATGPAIRNGWRAGPGAGRNERDCWAIAAHAAGFECADRFPAAVLQQVQRESADDGRADIAGGADLRARELLENAAKYSSEVMVSVHNRGPVIGLEDREQIFERFYRCPSHRHSAPGTGIGLSVARHLGFAITESARRRGRLAGADGAVRRRAAEHQ